MKSNINEPVEYEVSEAEKYSCRACGATKIIFIKETQRFRCKFCRSETIVTSRNENVNQSLLTDNEIDLENLNEVIMSKGMGQVCQSDSEAVSFLCPSCRAEMTTNVDNPILRCHWCRHQISAVNKITNGVAPDYIIPFSVSKEKAQEIMSKFLKKKRFFACPQFVKTFCLEEIRPVYLPYIMIDVNVSCKFSGEATKKKTLSDYLLFSYFRSFNMTAKNIFIEANKDYVIKMGENPRKSTKKMINFIQPFESSKLAVFSPKFLSGEFRAEFRNVNPNDIMPEINDKIRDIALYNALNTMDEYDHAFAIFQEEIRRFGEKYSSVLAPVWLYSYKDKNKIHYACVNGTTGKTIASVPINLLKLIPLVSGISIALIVLLYILFGGLT